MTGYPGDEHVFCVVGIVLARSPDCNLRSSGSLCVSAVYCLCACVSRVCSAFLVLWICVSASSVCLSDVVESVQVASSSTDRHLTKSCCSCQADSRSSHNWFRSVVEGPTSEHSTRDKRRFDAERARRVLLKNERGVNK